LENIPIHILAHFVLHCSKEKCHRLNYRKHFKQAEVGAKLNISQRSYAHFEAGTRGIPTEILIALADLYKVNIDYLVERTDKREMLPRKHS